MNCGGKKIPLFESTVERPMAMACVLDTCCVNLMLVSHAVCTVWPKRVTRDRGKFSYNNT